MLEINLTAAVCIASIIKILVDIVKDFLQDKHRKLIPFATLILGAVFYCLYLKAFSFSVLCAGAFIGSLSVGGHELTKTIKATIGEIVGKSD